MICYDLDNIDKLSQTDKLKFEGDKLKIESDKTILNLLRVMINQQKITNKILMDAFDIEILEGDLKDFI